MTARCELHPAYEADYCPACGTARVIGSDGIDIMHRTHVSPWRTAVISLDGEAPVLAQFRNDVLWNGWLCPAIDALACETVLAFLEDDAYADDGGVSHEWDDDGALLVTEGVGGDAYTARYEPDADGLYALGAHAWVWSEDVR